MVESIQLQRRRAQRLISAGRRTPPSIDFGIIPRGRLFQRAKQQQQQDALVAQQEADAINKVISDINSGRIKSITQIPEKYRSRISATQQDLTKISGYYSAKKEADLWAKAFIHAEAAISRNNPLIVAFSSNPYVKKAYKQLRQDYAAYKQRKENIQDIRSGKIQNVEIRGSRIWDTTTGEPITPAAASKKEIFQTTQAALPQGEVLLKDKDYNILGIQSGELKRSFQLDQAGIDFYNKNIGGVPGFDFKTYAAQFKDIKKPKPAIIELATKERGKITTEINKAKVNLQQGDLSPIQYYQNIAQWAGGTIAKTLIDSGLGTRDLVLALKEDPESTLLALGPGVIDMVQTDFKRATSGDPLALGDVGLEYFTFAKVGQAFGKVAKLSKVDKFLVGVARKMSPKYFNKIILKGVSPPISLRRAVVKTAAGRKAANAAKIAFKNTATVKQFNKYSLKVKKGKALADRKIANIVRQAQKVKKVAKVKVAVVKGKIQYRQALKQAKKMRLKAAKKGRTLQLASPDYKQALSNINALSDAIARVKTFEFLNNLVKRGESITKKQADELLVAVKKQYRNALEGAAEYQTLIRLSRQDRFLSVRLIKQGKIKSAKKLFDKLFKIYLNAVPIIRIINKLMPRIKKGLKVSVGAVKRPAKRIEKVTRKKIAKFKSKIQFTKEKIAARKLRVKASKTRKTLVIGDSGYMKAVDFIENFADTYAKIKAKRFIMKLKKSGRKIGLGQEEELIRQAQIFARKRLNSLKEFKDLKYAAKLNKPFVIELRRLRKLPTANSIKKAAKVAFETNIEMLPTLNKIIKSIRVTKKQVRIIKRKVSPKRIRKKVKRKIEVIKERRMIKKTIRYRMEKARPLRQVTLDQLRQTHSVTGMNKFIDRFFKELELRQKITVSPKTYSQMKNILKKRMRNAIKTGNRAELKAFGEAIRKLVADMNRKSNKPTIKVKTKPFRVDKKPSKKPFEIKTIPEFEPTTPKGSYMEVKNGQTVLLQKVKTKQIQKAKIISIQKKSISLAPLVEYGVASLTASAIKNIRKSKQAFAPITTEASLMGVLQDSKQDLKVLQAVAQDVIPRARVVSVVASAVNSKTRVGLKLKTKQIQEKKKPLVRIRKKVKKVVKRKKGIPGYNVLIKKKARFVRMNAVPLSLPDSKDMMAVILDNTLARTGRIMPLGLVDKLGRVAKSTKGYFRRNSKKFRIFKKRQKKKIYLEFTWIEVSRYALDSTGEKRGIVRRRVVGRKTTTTQQKVRKRALLLRKRMSKKRKLTPLQRRRMKSKK